MRLISLLLPKLRPAALEKLNRVPTIIRGTARIELASKRLMEHTQRNWKRLLKNHAPLLLPAASDALTAKLIEQAGFPAYQIGGFALDGMRFGFPDMDVNRLGEKSAVVQDIMRACNLPVLVDCDDGYEDEKNVTHTIHAMTVWAPPRYSWRTRGHPKNVGTWGTSRSLDPKEMVNKLKAACALARSSLNMLRCRRFSA